MSRKKLISIVLLSALLGSMLTVFAAGALLRSTGLYADDVLRLFGV
ncbi:MAG: S41 family peptidase, partial [Selenomonas massiliensis]